MHLSQGISQCGLGMDPNGLFYIEMKPEIKQSWLFFVFFGGGIFQFKRQILEGALCPFPLLFLSSSLPTLQVFGQKRKTKQTFFLLCNHLEKEKWQYTRCKYCGNRLQAWTTFISPGEGKRMDTFLPKSTQSVFFNKVYYAYWTSITSLLCPHGVNEMHFFIPKVDFSDRILFSTILLFNKNYWCWAYFWISIWTYCSFIYCTQSNWCGGPLEMSHIQENDNKSKDCQLALSLHSNIGGRQIDVCNSLQVWFC